MKTITQATFLKRIKDAVKHYDMIKSQDRILVAVSGGADSVCLLKVLSEFRRPLGVEIVAANLDHGIRGKESRRDSNFVKSLAKEMGIELVCKKVKISSRAKNKKSVEERGREERYKFFKEAAKRKKCNVIATGHNLNDQAETVMMRVILGGSISGLSGIPPVRDDGVFRIIRPLIRTSREEIIDFLKKENLVYVTDSTNLEEKYLRNSIRLKVLPYLEQYNPQVKRSLANIADSLREEYELTKAIKMSHPDISGKGKDISVLIHDVRLKPKAVQREIFKNLLAKAGGNIKKLNFRHWMELDFLVRSGVKGKSLDFPGNVMVKKDGDSIIFKKRLI